GNAPVATPRPISAGMSDATFAVMVCVPIRGNGQLYLSDRSTGSAEAAPPAPSRIAAAIAWRSRGVVVLNSVEFMVASSVIVILLFLSVFADCIDVPIIDLVTIPAVVIRVLQVSI